MQRYLTKIKHSVKKIYLFLILTMAVCVGCQLQVRPPEEEGRPQELVIDRFDRIESLYLTMGDYAALSQMRTDYPVQTRTLIEDVLQLGAVNDVDINNRFLIYFQDSTLQALIAEVAQQYENMDDINRQLNDAFRKLQKLFPQIVIPHVYTQVGSLDQSIVVGDSILGISLDKYLGADHPIYVRYGYTEGQRRTMTREFIVPDCLCFYLLSQYPLSEDQLADSMLRHWHIAKIQCLVNQVLDRRFFNDELIDNLEQFRLQHRQMTAEDFLSLDSI